jgi:hypothetical protein
MKKVFLLLLSLFMIMGASSAFGQSSQDDMDPSNREFQEWAKSLSEFVKDVRFNEKDIQDFINLWGDFSAFGDNQGSDNEEEYVDFNSILNDSAYRSWAKSKGLDSNDWLKKSMRITAVMMQTQMEENMSGGQFDMKEQLVELEKMREQMGEEMYLQMKQALEAGAAAMQGLDNSYKELPVPTASEKILLVKYNNQLMNME